MSSMTPAQARKAQLQKLLAQRVLARRRLLQFTQMTHPAYSAGWVHDDICRRLERFSQEVAEKKSPRLMLLMPPRHGKLLADDTMVLTSEGWKTHGDLVKGDKVMGLKGWTEVIGVSRPGVADCEVTTNAGTRIKCHRRHEWGVEEYAYRSDKRSYRYNVIETLDLLAHKAKNGHMRGAGAPTMRRFYLPSPDFTVHDLSVRRMLQYRRNPRNGGRLAIEDVTELEEPVPGKCIQVAAEDGIYLVTRDFVPTHNSELASIRFPAWHLGHNPTHEIINVGYNLELPMKFSRKVREVMRDPHYKAIFPDSQLDPDSQSVEAWMTTRGGGFTAAGVGGGITGKGCFRTSTHVHTRNGILPISDVRVGDEVLGYDHAEQRPQWTRVLAVHAGRLAGPARKHGSIWCTPDHELFVPGRGYVPAGEALAQGLPILRWEESSARCVVSSLSDGAGAGDEGSAGLRAVQQPVPSSGGRAHQAHGSWGWEPHVLFGRVFPGLAQGAGRTATRLVRELQRAVGEAVPAALLFAGVLPRSATAADGVVQRGVSVVEEAGAGARRASVRDDGQDADARGAPYRPRPYEQRADEPYFSLEAGARVLSFTPGWSAGRVAELVRGEGEVTVDLQTTAGNLFVEGVLAHNCHILVIDDPIKNQEEADSILVRDKLWDWYQSTAYTRLAPGGGVLVIECMTGDTPVLMADGTEKRLDEVRAGDEIATWENGRLSTTTVAKQRSSGNDAILKITTKSGKVLRANGRHPFLATLPTGELKWIRARSLSTANKIVAVRGSAVSGPEWSAQPKAVSCPQSAVVSAPSITPARSGPTGIARLLTTLRAFARAISSIVTGSRLPNMSGSSPSSRESAPYAAQTEAQVATPSDGDTCSQSTTATRLGKSVGCSATAATSELDILELSPPHLPLHAISDFTLDEVISVEADGIEEVFDVQVDRTTNFIANGAVSSNTWWSDDDLAGRLQQTMSTEDEADQFEIIRYPALSEHWEYHDDVDPANPGQIIRTDEPIDVANPPPGYSKRLTLLRPKDTCLHEDRYPTEALKRIRANLQPRIWSALYQQNPVPDEGMYFKKGYFRYQKALPSPNGLRIYTAWDFAIGEKQQNDWTVGATVLQDETDTIYVLEIFRMKGDSFQIVEAMLDVALRWGSIPTTGYLVGAEDGQIWRAIEPLLKKRMGERRQYPPYEVMRPMTDKLARARPLQGRMQQGRVVFPEGAAWLGQAEKELLRFPAGAHDDVVDALAWAAQLCMGKEPPRLAVPPPLPSWRDKLNIVGGQGSHLSA